VRWQRETSTADLLVEAGIPLATTGLVVSLVFFLIDLSAEFHSLPSGSMKYVFFLYIFGVVLINRVCAMYKGYGTGRGYALAMACTMLLFVAVSGGGLALLAIVIVVWVVADRVTQSCSFENDATADAGTGIVDSTFRFWKRRRDAEEPAAEEKKTVKKDVSPFRKKHPGRAVFYFAFLALPMFAAGQHMVPDVSPQIGAALMGYTIAYISSSLLLLMFTSYSGLRRYLNSRRTNMPGHIGMFWLVTGTLTVIAAITVARGMPMPMPAASSPATVRHLGDQARFMSRGPKMGLQDAAKPDSSGTDEQWQAGKEHDEPGPLKGRQRAARSSGPQKEPFAQRIIGGLQDWFLRHDRITQALIAVTIVFFAIVAIPLVLTAISRILGGTGRIAKSLFGWAPHTIRRVLQALGLIRAPKIRIKTSTFKLPSRRRARHGRKAVQTRATMFPNPFANNRATSMSLAELIDYSYQALVARAGDIGVPRSHDQTEYEFLADYAQRDPGMHDTARTLTEMHLFSEFSMGDPPKDWLGWLQQFWNRLA